MPVHNGLKLRYIQDKCQNCKQVTGVYVIRSRDGDPTTFWVCPQCLENVQQEARTRVTDFKDMP